MQVADLGVAFDRDGEGTADDALAVLDKVTAMPARAIGPSEQASQPGLMDLQHPFAADLQNAFDSSPSSPTTSTRTCSGSSTTRLRRSRARSSLGRP